MVAMGEVVSVQIIRPGRSGLIAKNGWLCSHPGCDAVPTVEVRFTRRAHGLSGCTVGCHGTCAAHAKAHARSLKPSRSAEVIPCPPPYPQ